MILIGLDTPGPTGLETIPRLRKVLPNVGIIALTLLEGSAYRQAAMARGGDGRCNCVSVAETEQSPEKQEENMAFKVHTIKKYNYSFDARAGGPGRLQLWGETGKIAEIRFVDDDAAVPPPTLLPNLEGANASFKRSALSGLIDMLRNESPVSVTVNDQGNGFVFIHTGLEPAGEAES